MGEVWEELRDAWDNTPGPSEGKVAWLAVEARARELLAKPVATREGVEAWLRNRNAAEWDGNRVTLILSALTHFAPPCQRMCIEGMSRQEIETEMYLSMEEKRKRMEGVIYVQECARVAHRLATTPAPEVDPDAGALAWLQTPAGAKAAWARLTSDQKAQVRAFAAMEKGNG